MQLRNEIRERRPFEVNNFDLLRIFASTQVLLFHTVRVLELDLPAWMKPLQHFPGVPIFFVISGFLVSASYERSKSVSEYALKRALRIYPGLWGCIIVTAIVVSALGYPLVNLAFVAWLIAQFIGIIYTPEFLKEFGFGSYNGSLWTISVELQFYFVLPILYLLMDTVGRPKRVVIFLLFVFYLIALSASWLLPNMGRLNETIFEKLIRYSFVVHFYLFLAGVALQKYRAHESSLIYGKGIYWLAIYAICVYLFPTSIISIMALKLLLAISVISVAYTFPNAARRTLSRVDISYGVYIYHGLILNVMVTFGMLGSSMYILVAVVASYATAYISWIAIERRFLYKNNKYRSIVDRSIALERAR